MRLYTEEKLGSMSEEDIMSILYDRLGRDYIPEDMCPICQFIEYSDYDLCKYLEKTTGIEREEAFAEVKKYNKRRKKLYDSEYITYVCQKCNLNPVEIVCQWKDKFGTYENFKKFL